MRRGVYLGLVMACCLAVMLLLQSGLAEGAVGPRRAEPVALAKARPDDGPRLADRLAALYHAHTELQPVDVAACAVAQGLTLVDADRVRVVVQRPEESAARALSAMRALGFQSECSHGDLEQGVVPIADLVRLSELSDVTYVRPPLEPVSLVTSEGVSVIGADTWHGEGYDGSGLTVAILDGGFSGFAGLLGSELPASVVSRSFRYDGDIAAGSIHGTGCAEIVYDVAPGAAQYLVNFYSDVEYGSAVSYLRSENVDIISCSMGWPISGPGDGTGTIATTALDAHNDGILWVNAAGNHAQRHWLGTWADADSDNVLDFTIGDETNRITVDAPDAVQIGMRWVDTWGAAQYDFQIELYDSTSALVNTATTPATGAGDPTRFLYQASLPSGDYDIVVRRVDAEAADPEVELFVFQQDLEHVNTKSSILIPGDVKQVLTVGAVPSDDPATIEYYSSRGPSRGGRVKPDLAAPDRVSGAMYGDYDEGTQSGGFWGTSAAAPHAAGSAALVWQYYAGYTNEDIADQLRALTTDEGSVGPDNDFGRGVLALGPVPVATTTPATPTETSVATLPPTATDTATPTVTETPKDTPTPSATATHTMTPTSTATPTNTPTPTVTPTLLAGLFADTGQLLGNAGSYKVELADLDGDGDLDAFVANSGGTNEVWINDGLGSFANSGQSLGSRNSQSVALGDLDRDGDLDAFVANYGEENTVWLNNGNGVMSDYSQRLGSNYSRDVSLGDVDGDGDLDAFVANDNGQANKIWLNDGTGAFVERELSLGDRDSKAVELGDMDGDGDLDAYVGNFETSDIVWVNHGLDAGKVVFVESSQILTTTTCTRTWDVALGDVEGDGDLDVWAACGGGERDVVWVNNGSGILTESTLPMIMSNTTHGVDLADIDGDGDLDAFVANYYGEANRVYLNHGGGWFLPTLQLFGSSHSMDVSLGDIDNDGDVDAFVANYFEPNTVWKNLRLSATRTPTFTPVATATRTPTPTDLPGIFYDSGLSLGTAQSTDAALGDLDGDGDLDAFVANVGANRIWRNDGSGVFSDTTQVLGSRNSQGVALGDLDGDGDLDAYVANVGANAVWLNDGLGTFLDSAQSLGSAHSLRVALGDLNGDGALDAVVANGLGQSNAVWINDGTGSMAAGQSLGAGNTRSVDLGDIDGDSDLDIILGNMDDGAGNVEDVLWENNGSASFTAAASLGISQTQDVVFCDIDGDGDLDLVTVNGEGEPNRVWRNNGTGSLIDTGQALGSGNSRDAVLGDLDRDGDADLVVANIYTQANTVWLNATVGTFYWHQDLGNSHSMGLALGDVDGDGDLDLFVANYGQPNRLWLNGSQPASTPTPTLTPTQGPTVMPDLFVDSGQVLGNRNSYAVSLGDLDGDGDVDAFVANSGSASHVWRNIGSAVYQSVTQTITSTNTHDAALGDLDGDGDLDAFLANYGSANWVWFNGGSGYFTDSGQALGASHSESVALGDVDGDGDLDAAVANTLGQSNLLWLNDGTGTFTSGQSLGAGDSRVILFGDADGDGDLDVYVGNDGQSNWLWLNNGTGVFTDSGMRLGSASTWGAAMGSVDPDGDLDVLDANNGSNALWLNNGLGALYTNGQTLGTGNSHAVALGDVDDDGDLDAFVGNIYSQANRVWRNDGAGSLVDTGLALGSAHTMDVELADLDGDGDLDAFVANFWAGNEVWLNQSIVQTPTPTPTPTHTPTSGPTPTPTRSPTPTMTATGVPVPSQWVQMGLAGMNVASILSRPGDVDQMLACTSAGGQGVYRSTNGGSTWAPVVSGLTDTEIHYLVQADDDPWTVWAGARTHVWKSMDGGDNWGAVTVGGAALDPLTGLAATTSDPSLVFALAASPCSAIFASNTGGSTFAYYPAGVDLCSSEALGNVIAISESDPARIYVARGPSQPELYRSDNYGADFQRLADLFGGAGVNALSVGPVDNRMVYAATSGSGIYLTRDAGASWSPAAYGLPGNGVGANVTALVPNPNSFSQVYAAVQGSGVYVSDVSGYWWVTYGHDLPTSLTVNDLWIPPESPGSIWAATTNGVWAIQRHDIWLPMLMRQAPFAEPTPTTTGQPPVGTATPTATHIPGTTPTATPWPGGCSDVVSDGGFESGGGTAWERPLTPRRATYATGTVHAGNWAMQMGIPAGETNEWTWSSTYQTISIPAHATSATLRLWWWRHTDETSLANVPLPGAEGRSLDDVVLMYDQDDVQEILLYDRYFNLLDIVARSRVTDSGWTPFEHSLTEWRGSTIIVYFNAYNNGTGGTTWMFVDDVSVEVCQ